VLTIPVVGILPFDTIHGSVGDCIGGVVLGSFIRHAIELFRGGSVVPYSLELEALRRIRTQMFGVLMSAEPAMAALAGLIVIGQGLTALDVVGISLVVTACAGATLGSRAPAPLDV
jgi:threonine/homoserine efflux transporter RhtA